MFVITTGSTYKWTVKVAVPVAPETYDDQTFTAEFRRIGKKEIEALTASAETSDDSVARAVLVGWEGVQDADGNDVPFSDAAVAQLLDVPGVAYAVVMAFLDSVSGAAKRKN